DLLRLCTFLHPDAIPEEIFLPGVPHLHTQQGATDRFLLLEALKTVLSYSLLRRQGMKYTYSMHRRVQAELRDSMDGAQVQQWMERAVHALHPLLPEVEASTWGQYERLVPHALVCTNHLVHSEQSRLELASLLFKTASYLFERAQNEEAESLFLQA